MESENFITREGFRVLKTDFAPPANAAQLEPNIKRKITICNLFLNHKLPIKDIARILDESYGHAVSTLIEQRIVQERRKTPREQQEPQRRSSWMSKLK
jgi:hypothetical protein